MFSQVSGSFYIIYSKNVQRAGCFRRHPQDEELIRKACICAMERVVGAFASLFVITVGWRCKERGGDAIERRYKKIHHCVDFAGHSVVCVWVVSFLGIYTCQQIYASVFLPSSLLVWDKGPCWC